MTHHHTVLVQGTGDWTAPDFGMEQKGHVHKTMTFFFEKTFLSFLHPRLRMKTTLRLINGELSKKGHSGQTVLKHICSFSTLENIFVNICSISLPQVCTVSQVPHFAPNKLCFPDPSLLRWTFQLNVKQSVSSPETWWACWHVTLPDIPLSPNGHQEEVLSLREQTIRIFVRESIHKWFPAWLSINQLCGNLANNLRLMFDANYAYRAFGHSNSYVTGMIRSL